jgi:hypothetical protein
VDRVWANWRDLPCAAAECRARRLTGHQDRVAAWTGGTRARECRGAQVTASAEGATLTFVLLVLRRGATWPPKPRSHPRGVIVDCARRSEANFPGAFAKPRNLVVGPLALVGAGDPTSASVVREFGGNKFPLLVKAGHIVTVRLPRAVRSFAGLAYGGLGRRALPRPS